MLRKLMKYEFMAMGRVFLPVFAALIAVSIVNRLLANLPALAPVTIGRVLSGILIASIAVLTLILTLQRFRNNLLSSEGYLMMTLPVSTDRLILSKLFVAAIWSIASSFVVIISILIMTMDAGFWRVFSDAFRQIIEAIALDPFASFIYAVEIPVLSALTMFTGILMLYACMSLSMLVNKRRGLFTFGAFIVISTVLQTLVATAVSVIQVSKIDEWFERVLRDMSDFAQSQVVILIYFIISFGLCAGFYYITRFMLKNRLNLQ